MTIVYISHYMEEVQACASRVGILDHCELIACDTVPHLLLKLDGQILSTSTRSRPRCRPATAARRNSAAARDKIILTAGDVPKVLLKLAETFAELQVEPDEIVRTNRTSSGCSCT